MTRAGFCPRAAALFVDLLAFTVAAHAVVLADFVAHDRLNTNDFGTVTGVGVVLIVVGIAVMEAMPGGGWLPGKRVMGLAVRAADGSPATAGMRWRRSVAKFSAFLLAGLPTFLFAITGPYAAGTWSMDAYQSAGLYVIAVIGAVIALGAMLVEVGGCFRAMRADGLALHDLAAGTAVFPKGAGEGARRGFTPVMAAVEVASDGDSPPLSVGN